MYMDKKTHIIDQLGGPSRVAELLGWKGKPGQVQRIFNWKTRGIPARVLLDRPDIFGAHATNSPELKEAEHV